MYGDFPAIITVYTPYIHMYVWFWPTLLITSEKTSASGCLSGTMADGVLRPVLYTYGVIQ